MIIRMSMYRRVLLLNASYEPLTTVAAKRAAQLLLENKAEIISSYPGEFIRSARREFPCPSVLRLVRYVDAPRYRKAYLTRRAVLMRDNYTCAYCGEKKPLKDMTMDHILPRSRKGPHTWKNVIACCFTCNQLKGDRTPEEMGWRLRFPSYTPDGTRRVAIIAGDVHEDWKRWLQPEGT